MKNIILESKNITRSYVRDILNEKHIDEYTFFSISFLYSNTKIEDHAFYGLTNLLSINDDGCVVSIGKSAFEDCSNLIEAKFPIVRDIGDYAFSNCSSLAKIELSDSGTDVGNYSFSNCKKLKVVCYEFEITSIGEGAFANCVSIEKMPLKRCRRIGSHAFTGMINCKWEIDDSIFFRCEIEDLKNLPKQDVVFSLTSYGQRICPNILYRSLEYICKNKIENCTTHVVLTVSKEDYPLLDKKFIKSHKIEVLVAPRDLKSHNKYFYSMSKYRNSFVITCDDDQLYLPNCFQRLYNFYLWHCKVVDNSPAVICGYADKIINEETGKLEYGWSQEIEPHKRTLYVCQNAFCGTLFPPDILKVNETDIYDILNNSLKQDDIMVSYMIARNKVPIVDVQGRKIQQRNDLECTSTLTEYNKPREDGSKTPNTLALEKLFGRLRLDNINE